MCKYGAIALLKILVLSVFITSTHASVIEGGPSDLAIRAGKHPGFLRVVFDGQEKLISRGIVSRNGGDITVHFPDAGIKVKKAKLPFPYKIDKDAVMLSIKKAQKLNTFRLKNPSRLVIDVYAENALEHKAENKKVKTKDKPKAKTKTAVKNGEKTDSKTISEQSKEVSADNKKTAVKEDNKKEINEDDFIPEKYKHLWGLLKTGNSYGVTKELPQFKPDAPELLAPYHYIFATAYTNLERHFEAIEELRLVYIYAEDEDLKEMALLKRADLYREMDFVYEARADYLVFIRDFPSSRNIEKAHLGLAACYFAIGEYKDAIRNYKKSGSEAEALFGLADSLQNIERVSEAESAYGKALLADKTFPDNNPETFYLLSENYRMTGDLEKATKQLLSIVTGPYQYNASISLGLIAMEEEEVDEAVRLFQAATLSKDNTVKVQALFSLSLAYMKTGKFEEAKASLEEIRHKHIGSHMYKDTLLILSKLYRKENRIKESVSLLKELVYGTNSPAEAFEELEQVVLQVSSLDDKEVGEHINLVDLWSDVGQWLIDGTREAFLLKVAGKLRYEGRPFIKLCTWLVEHASRSGRGRAATDLAAYYAGIGDTDVSMKYIRIARDAQEKGDAILRIEAQVYRSKSEYKTALNKLMEITKLEESDLDQLGSIIIAMNKSGSKDVQRAVDFYKETLSKSEWPAENYLDLADILYHRNKEIDALKYYRLAHRKDPDDEWAMYRVGRGSGMPESEDMYGRLQQGDNLLGRLAKSKLMETALLNKVSEVY